MWLVNRVPEERRSEVAALVSQGDMEGVYKIFREYRVIPSAGCPSCQRLFQVTQWAIYALNEWESHGLETTGSSEEEDGNTEAGQNARHKSG